MREQSGEPAHGWMDGPGRLLLQLAALAVPPLFVLVNPWTLAGVDAILAGFGTMAFISGALLRTWWASVVVPALVIASIAGHALIVRESGFARETELSRAGAVVLAAGLLVHVAVAAAAGVWAGVWLAGTADDD